VRNIFFYPTNIGKIGIAADENAITNIYFHNEPVPKEAIVCETELINEAGRQVLLYLDGRLREFTLSLAPQGTVFMQQVWESLRLIPYGETRSYGEIAHSIDNKKACRAVGMANNRNPIPILIPCHRVIGANGKLIGYGGGLAIKAHLLDLEKKFGNL